MALLLFLLAAILYPADMPESRDPTENFLSKHRWFYGFFVALSVVEILDSWLKDHIAEFGVPYVIVMTLFLTGGALGFVSKSKRVHTAVSLTLLTSVTIWIGYGFSQLERSAS